MCAKLAGLSVAFLVWSYVSIANATLVTIGTATYDPDGGGGNAPVGSFNLIWDDDNNGNSIIWFDYSRSESWYLQFNWAANLGNYLTYNIDPKYQVTWIDSNWRLGDTIIASFDYSYDGSTSHGYNITSSEMGHLFYEELGNSGIVAPDGSYPQVGYGLQNTGDFENLIPAAYWFGTDWTFPVFSFDFGTGLQRLESPGAAEPKYWAMAVRSADIDAVPEPATILLFGTGIAGLIGSRLRRKK